MLTAINRNSSFVRLQDVSNVFSSVSTNPAGKEIILNFLLERWDDIYEGLMPESTYVDDIIISSAAGIRTQHQIDQIKNLKKNGKHAKNFGGFDEVIEESEHKVEWIAKHFQNLAEFFKERVKTARHL
ncbi:unnamed protein product [Cylicostephanus goldi]|uniref:ERAP1-like C-terminal domain-containing protein n=1 Tax=Cylicostephanus goldi TaxID=71465 RepID=A0A3P7NDH1_CYLGO|nr:unnamed protein product [Cylicostephanus goldi]